MNGPELPDSVEESEASQLLGELLKRAEGGGATVVTRHGEPIAAIVSMQDYEAAESVIDEALAARTYDDDGGRYSMAEVFGDESSEGGR
ncbi:type II toxin-antitoxin system prevent-host-death family antitoxin [Streptomyces sp. JJ66]|uniref:type II toxin-antitoxin system Phd/YefM family antitoxin n=1 Tax=Streptomyces sp. JJ66 TaxID=2803843 RepID=UPI001C580154|nr:type II toxin-antitoxin system prevent-host-death family antitoxin [Streptomyces sp. JJ66]MBW1603651.1 type II toxin-antitoxin system prevent-host-death family antitoxin [Streptomyces sp. JJ66]